MSNDEKRDRLARILKWSGGLVLAALISPVIFLAIKGLVGLIIAGTVGFAAIQLWPAFAYKLANFRMKLIVNEAASNPIETMQNLFIEKSKELENQGTNITDFETEVRNFDDQLGTFKQQYPDEAENYQEISSKMHEALVDMKAQLKEARVALKDFNSRIIKGQAIYKMACAAQKVMTLSKSAESTVFSQIREQVAFDSVRTQLNRAFSNLDMAVEKRSAARASPTAQLTQQKSNVIEASFSEVTKAGVTRK